MSEPPKLDRIRTVAEIDGMLLTQIAALFIGVRPGFTRRARLEAKNLLPRQQLVVLRRKSPKRLSLLNIDRPLLDAIIIAPPETVLRWPRRGFPHLLVLEVSPPRWPSTD
jgi:hypothetical protein